MIVIIVKAGRNSNALSTKSEGLASPGFNGAENRDRTQNPRAPAKNDSTPGAQGPGK